MDKSGGDTWITNVVAYSGSLVRTGIFIEWTDERLESRRKESRFKLPPPHYVSLSRIYVFLNESEHHGAMETPSHTVRTLPGAPRALVFAALPTPGPSPLEA